MVADEPSSAADPEEKNGDADPDFGAKHLLLGCGPTLFFELLIYIVAGLAAAHSYWSSEEPRPVILAVIVAVVILLVILIVRVLIKFTTRTRR